MLKRLQQVIWALAAFFAVAGLLFLGNWLYQEWQVNKPIVQKISAVPGVTQVEIEANQGQPILQIMLKPDAELALVWPEVRKVLTEVPGGVQGFTVQILGLDQPNAKIEEANAQLQFALYESLATGNYTQIPTALLEVQQQFGVKGKAYLKEGYLLVSLQDNEIASYQVIKLPNIETGPVKQGV